MFRRNSMMFTLAILTVTACAPELAEPHETDGPGTSTGDDADGGDEAEPTTGAPEGDDPGTTTGTDASTTGSDASAGENAGTTGDASSTGENDDGDTSGETPLHDSDGGEPPTEPPGGGAACEGQPCATHEDCNSLDALMCLPAPSTAPICVATCDFADPEACDGQPERCTQLDVAAVCLPPIPKVHDDSGACIQSGPNGGEEPSPPPPDVPCEGQPCQSNEDCENGLDDLVCLPDSTVPSRYCVETCDPADAQACDGVPERCTFVGGGMVCLPPIAKTPNDAGVCEPA